MNAEEAEVPDVEGHWESIEIFLFSNGQQYSPPRKYHLQADELNFWDETLSLLTQSLYGIQSPLINLYTTDGQLVEGPLELKDGLAYVAVTPPDTFIDAGYEKYLIRASRSWEKRQARKKIPGCCDPQKCCLCPEKEDEDSLESLLSATGGHFMSSAPSKPAAADVYRPRSGKFASTTGEHAVRPGENGVGRGEFEYSPVGSATKLEESHILPTARLVEEGTNSSEHAARLSKNGASPSEFARRPDENVSIASKNGVRPVEYGARLNENGARPGEYVASLSENGPGLSKDGARLKEYGIRPGENTAIPGEYETRPNVNRAKPGEYRVKPGKHETRPSINGASVGVIAVRPGEYEARPSKQGAGSSEYRTRWTVNGDNPSGYGVKLGEYETRPTVNGTKPSGYKDRPIKNETRPSINGVKTSEYGGKPAEYETKPGNNGAKPSEYKARPGENETRPKVNGALPGGCRARPGENETRPIVIADKPSEYGARPEADETRPSVNGAKSGDNGARSGEYETRLSVNGARPGEYGAKPGEYESRLTLNGALPGEYESRLTLNGALPGEHRARPSEYETRPGVNAAKPSEYGARPGENETRPSVNGGKSGDYEARSSINGSKPDEYEARPGEYETKPSLNGAVHSVNEARQSLNVAKPSEYGATPGEYESRPTLNGAMPGEHRARPGEFEIIPSVNGAKLGEYRATSSEYADRSAEQRTRSDEYGPRPAKGGAWSDENGIRVTVHEARPGNDGPWLNDIESKEEAYEIGLRDNERSLDDNIDRPDKDTIYKDVRKECKFRKQSSTLSPIGESELGEKGEYGVTEGDHRDKQVDPKGRASGNGGRGAERRVIGGEQSGRENDTVNGISEPRSIQNENARRPSALRPSGIENKRRASQQRGHIEHTRRPSGQAGAEIEQGGRTGELTREFDHGRRVSKQSRETNPAGKSGLNAARLSEQRNKQSDHLARLGYRESTVGDHEARAGDLGLRSSDHVAGLVNPGSRVADPGARVAVSGYRASPRDRMNSIRRNLDQPKFGTPGTRLNETAAKLNELEIKNRVGYPGAKQSSVGGTGAAGASQISEAQQHARRSSLYAGRSLTEKKHLSIGQNLSMLRKPTPISSVLHKSDDKHPVKTNKEILPKRTTGKASAIAVPVSNDAGQSKTLPMDPYKHITPPFFQPPTISIANLLNLATNKVPLENVIDEKDIIVISTHSFRVPESEIRSMGLDSVKKVVDIFEISPVEAETKLIYVEKSKASVTVNEGVQTNTEAEEQHEQEVSASSKAKVNSCTCTCALCCKGDHRFATVDPDENITIQNKDDVINLKLNIEVRNIVRSVYSCHKNCMRSRSLTNVPRSEKESQISTDDGMFVRRKSSLQLNNQWFRGNGLEGSSKLMVGQCAGCGRLNYPLRVDLPQCCDTNKEYFILLANSVNEDMDDCCNFNPPCRPCDLRQSQLKKPSSGIPIKQTLSEMSLDTMTTVTLSGVPLQRREIWSKTDTACQTEEPQGECFMTKRKVSSSEDTGARCDLQKESNSSISVTTQVDNLKTKHSCRKLCPQKFGHEDSQVRSEFCPPVTSCQKVQSVCSQLSSQACPQVQSKECQQASLQIKSQGCLPVSPTCSPCCPTQLQTQVCPQVPQVSDAQTQTQWSSVIARLHIDGRYSFHLPPLNSYPF